MGTRRDEKSGRDTGPVFLLIILITSEPWWKSLIRSFKGDNDDDDDDIDDDDDDDDDDNDDNDDDRNKFEINLKKGVSDQIFFR